jgi:hypothetical protein
MEVTAGLGFRTLPRLLAGTGAAGLSHSQMALIAIVVAVSVMMIISARRRRLQDANSPRAYAREQITRLREEAEIKDNLEAVIVQVQDVTRQLNAQLDTKFCRLEQVIRDADARIAELDRLVRMTEGRPACDVTVDDRNRTPAPAEAVGKSAYARVYALADAGYSPVDIAAQTGQGTGEIELILALRRKSSPPIAV